MGALLIVSGPPGSGKSTIARLLSHSFARSVLVAGDAFFAFVDQGAVAPWQPGSEAQNDVVIEAAALATGRFARSDYVVVYDGVVGPWYLSQFAATAAAPNTHYAVLLPDEQTCVDRVRTRVGHGFTDQNAARDMYRHFTAAPIDERHVVASSASPESVADVVRERYEAGELAVTT